MTTAPPPELPLRQRKFARTKLGLLDAAIRLLDMHPWEEIRVRDLCAEVEISEASFFNYFPQKSDLLVYFIQLWSLEMAWHADRLARRAGGLAAIEEVFVLTARRVVKHPNLIAEIIAFQARAKSRPVLGEISFAERRQAFPRLDGIENVKARDLGQVVLPLLEQAIAAGELPRKLDRAAALLGVASVFFGVPVSLRFHDIRTIGAAYRGQLRILWEGLRLQPAKERA
jgi:AcrR family transcriptional regulator